MKIHSISANNRKREFLVVTSSGVEYTFPYACANPQPSAKDPMAEMYVDSELGGEVFTLTLRSGEQGGCSH